MLLDTQEGLQLALEAARMGSWEWNVATGAILWSANLEALHGLRPGSFPGTYEAFVAEIHPDDRAAVLASISRTLEAGTEYHAEYRITWADRSVHWLEGRGRLFRDDAGKPLRMIGVCMDVTERKQAELALVESENRYRRLLASVTDYLYTVKLEHGRPVETIHSPGCEAVTGYPPSAFGADPYLWLRMIVHEDRPAVLAQVERVLAGEAVAPFEHRIAHRNGSIRWVMNTPLVRRDEQGRVMGYEGLLRDITRRKMAEEALRLSHQQYETLVNTIDGIVWECDVQTGRPIFVSRQASRLLGYEPERWLSEPGFWERRVHPEDREQTLALFSQVTTAAPVRDIEYRMIAADGHTVWLRDLVRLVVQNDRAVKLCGVMVDITDQKHAEEALQKSHGLLRAITEGTTDAMFVKDREGRYLMINSAGARYLGKTIEEVIGKDDTALFSPITAQFIREGDERVMATSEVQTYEDVGTAAGVTRTYLSTKGPYRDLQGNVIGLIGISRDITERKQAEKALHERERELGLARQIQQGLLPRTAPDVPGFEMGGAAQPTQETGGDYFDFLPMLDGRLGIAIGDASGHGIAAALLMAETRAYLRALALSHADLGQILTLINQHLVEDIERDWFVTLFLASLDPETRSLVFCSAGHCPGYILDAAGRQKQLLRSTGSPLGIDGESSYTAAPAVRLAAGDLVFLFTDGIMDACSPNQPPFGIERALEVIRSRRDLAPRQIVDSLLEAVRAYCGTSFDDMTAVILKVK